MFTGDVVTRMMARLAVKPAARARPAAPVPRRGPRARTRGTMMVPVRVLDEKAIFTASTDSTMRMILKKRGSPPMPPRRTTESQAAAPV